VKIIIRSVSKSLFKKQVESKSVNQANRDDNNKKFLRYIAIESADDNFWNTIISTDLRS
jgi:hypothetical protein